MNVLTGRDLSSVDTGGGSEADGSSWERRLTSRLHSVQMSLFVRHTSTG